MIGGGLKLRTISCIYSYTANTGLYCLSRLSSLTHCSPPISSRTSAVEEEAESNRHLGQAFGIPHRATLPSISDMTACFLTACEIASHRTLHSGRKPTYTLVLGKLAHRLACTRLTCTLARSRHGNAVALSHTNSHSQILPSRSGNCHKLVLFRTG